MNSKPQLLRKWLANFLNVRSKGIIAMSEKYEEQELDVQAGPVHVRTRGYRIMDIILILGFGLACVGSWFVWEHDRGSRVFETRILKAVEDNTAALRFQTCIASVDQKDRIMQLRRHSACWYMGQGYAFEEVRPDYNK